MTRRVFISYRRSSAARVDALSAALEAEGVQVWLDRNEIEDAASIQRRIDEGLASCHALLAWYCTDYPESRACQWELMASLIAASADEAPTKRILVVNPETDSTHVHPLPIRDVQHFLAPKDGAESPKLALLAAQICIALATIKTTFGAVQRLGRPQAHGFTPLGSNRFVGRVMQLWEVHSALTAGSFSIVAGRQSPAAAGELVQVRGGGGIGKSLLAEEYALRFAAFWPGGLFWLRAYGNSDNPDESLETLAKRRELAYGSQLVGFCHQLEIDTNEKSSAQLHAEIGRTLNLPYLWIVDDLPDCPRDVLNAWLAPSRYGCTLITTRSRRRDDVGTQIDLGLLSPGDARALLTLKNPPPLYEESVVTRILELLDGHALAIDVARAACRRLTYAGFCLRLESLEADAMSFAACIAQDTPTGHSAYIAATFLWSIRQLNREAMDCLRVASLLAATAIPAELVCASLSRADKLEIEESENSIALAIQSLLNQSLAEEADASRAFRVHTLISRTLIFCDVKGEPRRDQLLTAVVQELNSQMQRAADIREHAHIHPLLPHAQLISSRRRDLECLSLAGWIGRFELEAGRYREAENWYRTEYESLVELVGDEHPDTVASLHQLGSSVGEQGRLVEARFLKEKALAVCRRVLGTEHPDTLAAMNSLVTIMTQLGDFEGALTFGDELLEICRRVLGDHHPGTLTVGSNLASIVSQQGNHSEAQKLHQTILSARRAVLGSEHRSTLASMSNLATSMFDQGDYDQAKPLQEEVLKKYLRVLGDEHPDTLSAKANLAATLGKQGNHCSAWALEQEVVAAQRRLLGDEHPDTLTTMFNLGGTLASAGKHEESRLLRDQVIAVRRRVLGDDHPETLTDMFNLATDLASQGYVAEARDLKEAVLGIRRRARGWNHPDTLHSVRDLSEFLEKIGDIEGVRSLAEQGSVDFIQAPD